MIKIPTDPCEICGRAFLSEPHDTAKHYAHLEALAREATRKFETLTPEQQAAIRREQAIDWAYGQLMATTRHRDGVTREMVAEAYDKLRGR